MKRVLASGVFDILHPGHLYYLSEAKSLGDHLTVVVASDTHAAASKRRPLHSAEQRAALVEALQLVNAVQIGADPYDLVATTRRANPDIIALGHDQSFDEARLAKELADHDLLVSVVRLGHYPHGNIRSRDILQSE